MLYLRITASIDRAPDSQNELIDKLANASPEKITRTQTAAKQFEQNALKSLKALEKALSSTNNQTSIPLLANFSNSLFLTSPEVMNTILSKESDV